MKSKIELNEVLDQWRSPHRRDPQLTVKVWERIGQFESSERMVERNRFSEWWSDLIERPLYAVGMAASLVLCGFLAGNGIPGLIGRGDSPSVDTVYRLSIDPMMRLESDQGMKTVTASLRAPATLKWLQQELELDPVQFERVVLLHSLYESEFEKLFGKLVDARSRYQEMEERRFEDDVIDFFSVYELVKHQEDLKKTSNELRSELLVKLAEVMAPDQWERYQSLVKPETPAAPSLRTDV